jgi:hypothetical protein
MTLWIGLAIGLFVGINLGVLVGARHSRRVAREDCEDSEPLPEAPLTDAGLRVERWA